MNDYLFTDFDVLQLGDNPITYTKYPTRSSDSVEVPKVSRSSALQMAMDEEFVTQPNFAIDAGLEFFDCSAWRDDVQVGITKETTKFSTTGVEMSPPSHEILEKLEHCIPASSYELVMKLQESNLNLILVATSLDEDEVLQKLERTLDSETCRAIPLTFKNDRMDDVNVSSISSSVSSEDLQLECTTAKDETKSKNKENAKDLSRIAIKRKQSEEKDEKYWMRRNRNNEAAKKSREAKRARFVWIEARTKELEVENARLEEQLKMLETKVSELERRAY